ncbi:hypothetical protein V8E51_012834 [Hyaloscypha variabilis]
MLSVEFLLGTAALHVHDRSGLIKAVLFRVREQHDAELFEYWRTQVHGLVGIVPGTYLTFSASPAARNSFSTSKGLKYVDVGSPIPETADRTKGFNVSLVAVLDTAADAIVYATHPAHEKIIQECRDKLFEDLLICDMEFAQRT